MIFRCLLSAALLAATSFALAAPPAPPAKPYPTTYLTMDHSSNMLISADAARDMWQKHLTPALMKLYPVKKWGFVSEVEGGFDDAKVCVITARAMMLPRSGKSLVFQPAKTATAYGIQAGASAQQCQELAKAKLADAMVAVRASLMAR